MRLKFRAAIIVLTMFIVFAIGFLSIYLFGDYGWTIFVFAPLLIGLLPSYFSGKLFALKKRESYVLSFQTLLFACFGLLVFALEGIICVIMALPIFMLLTWFGAYLGYFLNLKNKTNPKNIIAALVLSSLAFMSFDYINEAENLIAVETSVEVNAPIDAVWKNVVTFNHIPEPSELIFKTGIAYPQNATISGTGVGAIRYCNFTTGSFVEPITTWDQPNLLQFDVSKQPIPMNEWNPFWEIHPPHLDGYFKSQKGQFALKKISDTKTQLIGTTFYKVDIHPEFYWKIWSDFIIHRIHERVLNHIKTESEKK